MWVTQRKKGGHRARKEELNPCRRTWPAHFKQQSGTRPSAGLSAVPYYDCVGETTNRTQHINKKSDIPTLAPGTSSWKSEFGEIGRFEGQARARLVGAAFFFGVEVCAGVRLSRAGRGRSSAFNTAFSSLVYGTMDFPCPIISDNIHGWGPTKPPEIFSDVPYAPFSKGDKLGKVADFTFSNRDLKSKFS